LKGLSNGGGVKLGLYQDVYDVVRQIPAGTVATYGQIAYIIGQPNNARLVGWALAALRSDNPTEPVPWQRVVDAGGRALIGSEQMIVLKGEGIEFDQSGRIDLEIFGWNGV
jgi:methylated-DNA-protein-cysteine methyltransferase related protein